MKDMVEVAQHDLGTLLVCSVRYSIGRNTYMPSLICSIIKRHAAHLDDADREVIAKSIMDELQYLERLPSKDSIDSHIKKEERVNWLEVVQQLQKKEPT
jgi:hypothetical protein